MKSLPPLLKYFLFCVYSLAILVSLLSIRFGIDVPIDYVAVVLFFLLGFVAEFKTIAYNRNVSQSVSTAILIAAVFVFPPIVTIAIAFLSTIISEFQLQKPWYRVFFNGCLRVISFGGAAIVVYYFGAHSFAFSVTDVVAIAISLLVHVVVTAGIMGTLYAIVNGEKLYTGWRQLLTVFGGYDLPLLPYGLVLAWLWYTNVGLFLVGLLPLVAMQRSFAVHAGLINEQAETKRLAEQQRRIQEATTVLLSSTDVHTQLDTLLKHLMDVFPVSRATVLLWDRVGRIDQIVSRGSGGPELPVEQWSDNLRRVSERGRLVRLDQEFVTRAMQGRPVILVPLVTPEDTVGCLVLVADSTLALDAQGEQLIETFAAQAALAIYQSQLIAQLRSSQVRVVQAERLAAVGTLAAGVAHEFNNLLAGISGIAQLALIESNAEDQKTALETVTKAAQQGGSITRGLLTFARQVEPKRELADVRNAVEPVLALMRAEFRHANVDVVQRIEPVPPIVCDIGMLAQCVLNLITNALDAMYPHGGTLTVELKEQNGLIRLSIGDTGTGIPEHVRDRIFEPFVSTKTGADGRLHGGTGLGLAITYGVVTDHGGTIEIQTQSQVGTTMTIVLPTVTSDQALSAQARTREAAPLHMIVVDDEPMIARSLHGLLTREGHVAEWFTEPVKALDAIRRSPVDVIFTDLMMPEMDGVTLLQRAKQWVPKARRVVVTGQIDPRQLERAQALGISAVIEKPFTLDAVRAVVSSLRAA